MQGGIERNEDQPEFLKKISDIKEGKAPGAAGLWVPPKQKEEEASKQGEAGRDDGKGRGVGGGSGGVVGDGGNSWKARQLARLKERAATEGKSLQVLLRID